MLLAHALSFLKYKVAFSDLPEVIELFGLRHEPDPDRAASLVLSLVYPDYLPLLSVGYDDLPRGGSFVFDSSTGAEAWPQEEEDWTFL